MLDGILFIEVDRQSVQRDRSFDGFGFALVFRAELMIGFQLASAW